MISAMSVFKKRLALLLSIIIVIGGVFPLNAATADVPDFSDVIAVADSVSSAIEILGTKDSTGVSATLNNGSPNSVNAEIILAVYEPNGTLNYAKTYQATIGAEASVSQRFDYDVAAHPGFIYKLFAWNAISFTPLCAPFVMNYSDYPGVPSEYHALLENAFTRAGSNRAQLESALNEAVGEEKEGVAFLIAYMQEDDLVNLTGAYILNHVRLAYQARNRFAWGKDIPKDIFLNNVLPYASMNERRTDWRGVLYERFAPYVKDCTTYEEAMTAINKVVREETGATFSTGRRAANQDALETIQRGIASCSGLSIVLVDALRSVGLPARIAGNRQWFDNRGNHSWVEIWINGNWHFTEYDPSQYGLDRAWFEHSSGRAEFGSAHGIFAVSYKPVDGGTVWPSSQSSPSQATGYPIGTACNDPIPAFEVTQRYLDAYQKALADEAASGDYVTLTIRGYVDEYHTTLADRAKIGLDVWEGPNPPGILTGQRSGGSTAGGTGWVGTAEDYVFTVNMRKNREYRILYTNSRELTVVIGEEPVEVVIYSVNKVDLKAAIDQANALTQADYTEASWAALTTALTTANTRFNSTSSSFSQVNTATNNLRTALANLVLDVPVTEISDL